MYFIKKRYDVIKNTKYYIEYNIVILIYRQKKRMYQATSLRKIKQKLRQFCLLKKLEIFCLIYFQISPYPSVKNKI